MSVSLFRALLATTVFVLVALASSPTGVLCGLQNHNHKKYWKGAIRNPTLRWILMACLVVGCTVPLRANVIIAQSLGLNNTLWSLNPLEACSLMTNRCSAVQYATEFSAGLTANVYSIGVIVDAEALPSTDITLDLLTDSSGTPGALIEQLTIPATAIAGNPTLVTLDSALEPLLSAGTNYWLSMSTDNANTGDGWSLASTGGSTTWRVIPSGQSAFGPWQNAGPGATFLIEGTIVPEPNFSALLSIGLFGIAATRWWKLKLPRRPERQC